ncbi:group II intron maturase-specific domain-containing protein [Leptospirillum ferriphilum]|uniref:group II intron maturase-specific domain-containing protein n=1 Tax=Leptospirillum ferriphilum TaxID=178606 RepID=UPI002117BA54|nr:group II intron maturase-specific domain-containing protein [Leptospirillum ferriphilum]
MGQHVRKYGRQQQCLTTPSQKNTKVFLTKVRNIVRLHKAVSQEQLIGKINQVIRGCPFLPAHRRQVRVQMGRQASILSGLGLGQMAPSRQKVRLDQEVIIPKIRKSQLDHHASQGRKEKRATLLSKLGTDRTACESQNVRPHVSPGSGSLLANKQAEIKNKEAP